MPAPIVPYYETTDLKIELTKGRERAILQQALDEAEVRLVLRTARGDREVSPDDPELVVPAVTAAVAALVHDTPGAEIDVLAADGTHAVTVWFEPGTLVVSEAAVAGSLHRVVPDEATLRTRWTLGPLVAGDRSFDPRSYGLLDLAMASLDPRERALVQDLTVRRDSRATIPTGYATVAAVYTSQDGGRIEVYDDAFVPTTHFVGTVAEPKPFQLLVLVHELGHAIHDAPARSARASLVRLEAEYERGRAELEAMAAARASPERWEALAAESNARVTRAHDVSAWFSEPSPVLEAWKAAKGREPAATTYGRHAPEEGFAEEFALFRTDPAALERASPRAAAWFRAGGHLAAAEAGIREVQARADGTVPAAPADAAPSPKRGRAR